MGMLTDRQQILYDWLQTQNSTTIEEIGVHFGISIATAYRDARTLVDAGLVQKTRRGIKLPALVEPAQNDEKKCAFCGGMLNERSAFVIHLKDGTQRSACCPHCGLLSLEKFEVTAALASDFLYGRMVNAQQATFLLESSVSLCCQPSVLCFATEEEARLFQTGFGGSTASLNDATVRLKALMSILK